MNPTLCWATLGDCIGMRVSDSLSSVGSSEHSDLSEPLWFWMELFCSTLAEISSGVFKKSSEK